MRKLVIDIISQITLAALCVAAFLAGALVLRVLWEGIILGWTVFGLWP
jgi:hypothetical protein